jgi:hypothetical protein
MHNCSVGFCALKVCRTFVAFCNGMWLVSVCAAHKLMNGRKKGTETPFGACRADRLWAVFGYSALDAADFDGTFGNLVIGG